MPRHIYTSSLISEYYTAISQVIIPPVDTTYWCAAVELPQEVQQQLCATAAMLLGYIVQQQEVQQQQQYVIRVRSATAGSATAAAVCY